MNPGNGADLSGIARLGCSCDKQVMDKPDRQACDGLWMPIYHVVGLPMAFVEPMSGIQRSLRGDE